MHFRVEIISVAQGQTSQVSLSISNVNQWKLQCYCFWSLLKCC